MASLRITATPLPGLEGKIIALDPAGCSLGRDAQNDLVLGEPAVSRRHARVVPAGAGWAVVDEGSGNGVWVNGARVSRQELADGDVIRIGQTSLVYEDPAAAIAPTVVLPAATAVAAPPPAPPPPPPPAATPLQPPPALAPAPAPSSSATPAAPPQLAAGAAVAPAAAPARKVSGCALACFFLALALLLATAVGSLLLLHWTGHLTIPGLPRG